VQALVGASPSTSAPGQALADLRAAIEAAGARPATLDEVRAVSPEAADGLERYLRYRGHVLYTGYDLEALTLVETPEVVLATIANADPTGTGDPSAAEEVARSLRRRVPEAERDRFDERLAEARAAMDLRDDNGPTTYQWPAGLLRRGLLEAGRRLVAAGRVERAEHVFELEPDEVDALVRRAEGPAAEELARRAGRRRHLATLDPPPALGPVEPDPPLDALPPNLALMVRIVTALIDELGMKDHRSGSAGLHGAGIGSAPYRGRARVAGSAEAAIAALEPGDVLVTRSTSPAFNLVLTLVGGLVTAEGGPMSHAAVLARELGFPAVVGAPGALAIPDGALVEVDPVAGRVVVLGAAPERARGPATAPR
jgi:pyruvate,water dikinase